ncbi:penicillin-binding protein 2 [Zobellia galactanivorans]|uniref:Penicillin-binding protein 2, Family GT51 n=1 Tax=Zobellia galactanivorans (strain DSM 12802 / CCUG 47099 / CIP 106680 / NCIMB 13871 / Dsij) TaxID=63186 RepID=G0LAD4_ZOBGA|nr:MULTISPECIES: penicillin-binding protein 2 [Zobellia]MBU3028288.1 penicillin-binding protein 2 [Zobellia galactanivorans]MDO6808571.1 penicillin-binding protein 2 [Zobellia galactanivorans]OWW26296.1 penicillin-binding protein 2 [Zobellia sp. OII3]CAZ95232.1 Penicillin-binding protein 2, Family GT51 [Zobellia galactanivorans]
MKKLLLSSIIVIIGITFLGRLSYLQIFSFSPDQVLEDPAIKRVYDYPERGYIYDRNGKLLVGNDPAYDVMVIPREVRELDTLEFCGLLGIDKAKFKKELHKARVYSPRLPSVFVPQLSKEDYARLQEKMRHYRGFYIQKRSLRYYDTKSAANVLGYISEVNDRDLAKNPYYVQGELTGRTGVEKQYEDILRGRKGVQYIQKDRYNRDIGKYKGGIMDTLPEQGLEINITIDKTLQEYGELLMNGKRGGIVALEPSSGEILAMISGPTYDPSLLVGRERSKNYSKLHYDSISKPLFDRSILAEGSPGSPFKTLNALVALQEGVITPNTTVQCYNGFYVGRKKRGCHCGGGLRKLNDGIYKSCNAYFAATFRKIYDKFETTDEGMDVWEKHMKSFGLGQYLGYDLPTGKKGRIPSKEYYDKWYGDNRWSSSYIISNSIGQGEVAATPIQLANMTAAIANRGHYFTPHILKKVDGKDISIPDFVEPKHTTIDKKYFEPVVQGMADVYEKGTARWLQIPGVKIAGKTGTVENYTKIDSVRVQLTDHSVFVAFAPVEDPKIAIAVYIENGYYGSRYAGHIASLMIEKYIKGEITRKDLEKRMLEKTLEKEYAKPYSGKEFKINEYVW